MARWSRIFLALSLFAASVAASAQRTITVTSPVKNDYLGKTNSLKFAITGAQFKVTLKVKATLEADPTQTFTVEKDFTPAADNKITDSVALNFGDFTDPSGTNKWSIKVTPTEKDGGGNDLSGQYNTVPPIQVFVDIVAPKFLNVNPINNQYVKGKITISAGIQETLVDQWKVQMNSGDFANNSGSTKNVNVQYDTNLIQKDGQQTIDIKVDDRAKNSATKQVKVTLDRKAPSGEVVTPRPNTSLPPNTDISVVLNVRDQFADSVSVSGVDVKYVTLSNQFLGRVSRKSTNNSGTTLVWTGRIRWTSWLPKEFKIVVTLIDKAGNPGQKQEVRVKIGNR
ncbi:MAG: hypothetical protein JST30_09300 [Armatimonadetes bacterium]|nr:hypothetical protein [Armatimonadota bacterium]